MYKINTGQHTFEVEMDASKKGGKINGETLTGDVVKLAPNTWHLLHENKSYNIQVIKADFEDKAFSIEVNGSIYEATAQDDFDLLLDKMGLANLAQTKVNNLKAPMPGLVLDILVEPGQQVEKGTPLVILEAMKMENVLKSPDAAEVAKVEIEKGQAVEKNTILLTFK